MVKQWFAACVPLVALAVLGATAQQTPSTSSAPPGGSQSPSASESASISNAAPADTPLEGNDPLLQPPPLPKGHPTLIGGKVSKVDKVRESVTVRPYGGGSIKVFFDDRTHIYRDGVETTMLGIHPGDRVYVDTLLAGMHVFAENIRVETHAAPADARGQVLGYNAREGRLEIRDDLTSRPVSFRVTGDTIVRRRDEPGTSGDLLPGSLVEVRFSSESPGHRVAREVHIYAAPGTRFVFAGKITHLDMAAGLLALQNRTDNKNYEVHFDPAAGINDDLLVGADVTVNALFNGRQYTVQNVSVNETSKKKTTKTEN
jgi:hypothetical protein